MKILKKLKALKNKLFNSNNFYFADICCCNWFMSWITRYHLFNICWCDCFDVKLDENKKTKNKNIVQD